MTLHCMPAAVASLATSAPGARVEIRGIAGRDGTRLPVEPGSVVQVLGSTGNAIRIRTPDERVLLVDTRIAALIRVEPVD